MPFATLTTRLMSALPESLWAEANRRLRLVPELWKLAEDEAVLKAFCALGGEEARWRIGNLGLAAYAAKHPECAALGTEAWLLGEGKDRLSAAYTQLTAAAAGAAPLQPLDQALPAALALRLRMRATFDWSALAREAGAQPERWRLPLQYLWGWVLPSEALFVALLKGGPQTAALAGQCLAVNHTEAEAVQMVSRTSAAAPAAAWPQLARAIDDLGEAGYARSLIQAVAGAYAALKAVGPKSVNGQSDLAEEVDGALLLAASEDYSLASPALTQAWAHTKQLGALLAGRLARLALAANDPVTALAGYQAALSEQSDNLELRTGLAQTLAALNRPGEALATLQNAETPAALVVAARAQVVLGKTADAQETLKKFSALAETLPPASAKLMAEAARLYNDLNDSASAIGLMRQAADRTRTDASLYLAAAGWLSQAGRWPEAQALALEAAALAPHQAATREVLGQALLQNGQPAEALPHFQSAIAFEPARWSAGLGLARAALATGQAALARDAAGQALEQSLDAAAEGAAHVILGQAYSALKDENQAFEHFHRASGLTPAAPEPWRAMAAHHRQHGATDRALATLEAGRQALTLAHSPDLAPLLADLAEAYQAAGRQPEAIVALREVCAAAPDAALAHRQLGALLRQQGYLAEAISVLRRALKLQPGDGLAAHELGLALEKNDQPDEAWAAYQQAVLARPAAAEPYLNLGRLTLAQCRRKAKNASPFQAVAALTEAASRLAPNTPPAAEAFGWLAQAQQLAGNLESALESYRQALQMAPNRTEWSLGFGEICLESGKPTMAIAALQEALAHAAEAQAATVHQALARAYAQSGLWPEVQHSAEAALSLAPETPALLALLAEAATHLKQPERAADYWRQAVTLNPRDAQMQTWLARSLLDAGHADEARAVYAQALNLAPDSAEVHLAAGQALAELGEIEAAYEILTTAAELAPRLAAIHAALGETATRAGKTEAAQAAYLRAAELTEGVARATYLRLAGEALWSMGRTAAAVALWQRAATLNPQEAVLFARLGMALVKLGQPGEALAALDKALTLSAGDASLRPEATREAARAALALGQLEKSAAYLERVIQAAPNDAEARFLLGQVREQQGQPDQALAHYRQAARLSPGEGQYLAASAETLARLGKLPEALKFVEEALAASADNPEVQQRAGDIYLTAGQPAEAAQAFQQLVVARPRQPQAHLALARALVTLSEENEYAVRADLKPAPASAKAFLIMQPLPEALTVLQQAAALGADPQTVRYWMGRAKAVAGNPQEARQLLETVAAAKALPREAQPGLYRALGLALRKSGQPQRALEALLAATQAADETAASADQAALQLEIGLTYVALDDTQGALNALKRAVAAAPDWPIGYFHLAEVLQRLEQRPEAIQVLQHALTLQPDAAAWHYRLAKIYQAEHTSAAALGHFQRAHELAPDQAHYAADLAHTLAHDGDLSAAAELFRRATDLAPNDDRLWTERGQTHLALKDHKAAADCFGRATQLAPANAAALLGGARVSLAQGDLHDAANKAEAAARLAPEATELHVEALVCLAEIQMARGENAAAEASFAAAAAKTRQPAPALLALGRLYYADGKLPEAIDALERAARALPPNADAQRNADVIFALLGQAYHAAGRPEDALAAHREAARISPRNAQHLLQLGRVCRDAGQLDQALAHLLQARDLKPGNDEILREVGLVYEQRKDYDLALEMYQQAIKVVPGSSANFTRAGIVLKQMKAYPEAAKALERAVLLDARNVEATKQLAVVSALNLMYGKQRSSVGARA